LGTRDEILKKDWDEKIQKQISDVIYYKLEKCLKNEPWMIRNSSTGEYALVQGLSSLALALVKAPKAEALDSMSP
jgi:hypothetical protein